MIAGVLKISNLNPKSWCASDNLPEARIRKLESELRKADEAVYRAVSKRNHVAHELSKAINESKEVNLGK